MNLEIDANGVIWYAATISLLCPRFNLSAMGNVFEEYLRTEGQSEAPQAPLTPCDLDAHAPERCGHSGPTLGHASCLPKLACRTDESQELLKKPNRKSS